MKTCIKCNTTKTYSEFHASKKCTDGYRGTCKVCTNNENRSRRKSVKRNYNDMGLLETPSQSFLKSMFSYCDSGNLIYTKARGSKSAGSVLCCGGSQEYKRCVINGVHYLLHRIIWKFHHGYDAQEVDHADQDKSNNKIENLRECTRSQNMKNRTYSKGASKFFGVSFRPSTGKWYAEISDNYNKFRSEPVVNQDDAAIKAIELMEKHDPKFYSAKIEANKSMLES